MPPRLAPTRAASRTARPAPSQVQPVAPLVPLGVTTQKAGLTSEQGAAADRRAHSRRHLLVVEQDRAPAGGRRAACRGSSAG
eukprot:5776092-Prymnesium_polylepis.1